MGQVRVLIVDDAVVVRRMLSDIISSDTDLIVVGTAANGKIALNKLPQVTPDVVILDLDMPEMNGYEFLCNIRADSKYNDLNVMMVTTESEISQMAKALEAGANEYLMKPFTKEMIAEKLEILGLTS